MGSETSSKIQGIKSMQHTQWSSWSQTKKSYTRFIPPLANTNVASHTLCRFTRLEFLLHVEHENISDDDDLEDEAVVHDNVIPQLLQEANSTQDPEDVALGESLSQPVQK